jgi:hypothetical protein
MYLDFDVIPKSDLDCQSYSYKFHFNIFQSLFVQQLSCT